MKKNINQKQLESIVVNAICNLDINLLDALDCNAMYYNLTKTELIEEFALAFDDYKSKGINKLVWKRSKCNHCFPLAKAFEFYNTENNEFIVRYIINSDASVCIVRLCDNKPPKDNEIKIPF